jgi:hypothetical protein
MKKITPVVQDVRFFLADLKNVSRKCYTWIINNNKGETQMAVATQTYKVGDLYTSQKSKVTGTILEIDPQANGNVRVKLDVNGMTRYTTWTAKNL